MADSFGMPTFSSPDMLRPGLRLFPEDETQAHPCGVIRDVALDRLAGAYVITLLDGRRFTYPFGRRAYVASKY